MTNGPLDHLDQNLVYLLSEPDEVRVRFILSDRFINYPRAVSIIEHAEALALQPKQMRAWGLGVVATPGAGKTMLAAALSRRLTSVLPPVQADGKPCIPALMITMTGAREARTINNRVLDELKAPYGQKMRLADREVLVLELLREADTRILIVDEIQDILSSTTRQRRAALDHIKLLMNSVHIPVLALGIPGALEAMKEDPHLATRFEWQSLPTWKCNDETRDLLNAFERVIPLRHASNLSSITMTKLIVSKSHGVLARMVRLVTRAAVLAVYEKGERITPALLERAINEPPRARPTPENHVHDE